MKSSFFSATKFIRDTSSQKVDRRRMMANGGNFPFGKESFITHRKKKRDVLFVYERLVAMIRVDDDCVCRGSSLCFNSDPTLCL